MAEAEKAQKTEGGEPQVSASYDDILRLLAELSKAPKTAPHAEPIAAALTLVDPTVAVNQRLLMASQAAGVMFYNAVAQQQKTNLIGMVVTANCIQALLDKPANIPFPNFPDLTGGQADQPAQGTTHD